MHNNLLVGNSGVLGAIMITSKTIPLKMKAMIAKKRMETKERKMCHRSTSKCSKNDISIFVSFAIYSFFSKVLQSNKKKCSLKVILSAKIC